MQRWHDFYIVAGTAAATLVGLLFVGLSLHLRTVIARPEVRGLARVTLANYALVLFLSLFIVIPESASSASLELIISGCVTLVVSVPSLVGAAGSEQRTLQLRRLMLRFGLSLVADGIVVAAGGVLAASPHGSALGLLVVATVVLIVVSLRNSWDLLVSVGAATLHEP